MIVHLDCNSFYASVEVAARPELRGRPVVVANNNEAGGGVILALNPQAKRLGLRRGDPVFKVKHILAQGQVEVCDVHFGLYRQVSRQIMQAVIDQELVLDFVQYSIDEFFGRIPLDEPAEVRQCMEQVVGLIAQQCGIPVSCGCSSTYTLAKVATWFAKKYPAYHGICVVTPEVRQKALQLIPVEEVWGIGRRSVPKLKQLGINTAVDFASLTESLVAQLMTTAGVNTWRELRGIPAVKLETRAHQQSIMHSRTFAFMKTEIADLREALSNYAADVAASLRSDHCVCQAIEVFICTNPHRTDLPQYSRAESTRLAAPTANTQEIVRVALQLLDAIFLPGYKYKRMGIVLSSITEDSGQQLGIFDQVNTPSNRRLMEAADRINQKFGQNTLRLTIQGKVGVSKC